MSSADELEVCSSCGSFVLQLNEETGWCDPCSGITPALRCLTCADVIAEGRYCAKCKYIWWLTNNADEIERVMAEAGISAATAKRYVRDFNRPICLSCNKPIKGGQKGRHFFCKKTAHCIKAHNAYHYHRRVQNRSHEDSVQRAVTASQILKLTNEAIHG